jgi:biopolymer transport protein ExbD
MTMIYHPDYRQVREEDAMAFASRLPNEPLGEMNTTPLIDVLLVLLVVFLLAIPASTHSLEFDLPGGPVENVNPVSNQIVVTERGAILWNGDAVNRSELAGLLNGVRKLSPEPQVRFEPEPQASYALSADVLRQVKQARLTNFGLAGNERYRTFGNGE